MIETWMNEQSNKIKATYQSRIILLIFLIVLSCICWFYFFHSQLAYRGWFTSTIFLLLAILAIQLYHLISQKNHRIHRLENFILKNVNRYDTPQEFYSTMLEPILTLDTSQHSWFIITHQMLFYFGKHDVVIPMNQVHHVVYHHKKAEHLYTFYNEKRRKLKTIRIIYENAHLQMNQIMKIINEEHKEVENKLKR